VIEQGLVMLVQGNLNVQAIAETGGFLADLPKDFTLPSWTYLRIGTNSEDTCNSPGTLTQTRLQIDCYSAEGQGADVIRLGQAIDDVLNGFRGVLPDDDATYVDSCFQSDLVDHPFDDASRASYRRMLEYEIWFVQPIPLRFP